MNVTATDADDTMDTNNGILGYSITNQDPPLPTPTMFTIDQASGLISVVTAGLDREEGEGFETFAKAVITVTDANDNAPVFDPIQYSAKVPENAVGFEVALLTVTDDDTPNTDAWTAVFKIVKGNEGNLFGITTTPDNMGQLTTVKGLDFETKRQHILLVAATNKAAFSVPLVTSTATITVDVEDLNEAPIFVPPVKNVTVREDLPSGQEVASYTAQDPDKAQIQKITYRIANDPAGWLSVNPDNGIITGNGQLDRESVFVKNNIYRAIILAVDNAIRCPLDRPARANEVFAPHCPLLLYPVYTLTVKAADQEGEGFETFAKAVITVTDANDNAPVFDPIQYSAKVPENAVGFEVALLTVTDDDTPNTDAWTAVFKIVKGNEGNLFGITTTPDNMGQLTTVKGLDFETKRQHILLVAATNKAAFSVPLVTSTATITVDVEDLNEAPIFVPPVKNVTVREDLPSGQEVASYTAQDPDKAQIQKITYRIANDPAGWLSVNPDNGIITGNGQLDRESVFVKNNIYRAIILAVDNGSPPTTGTGTLQITLEDVNDNGPYLEYRDAVYCLKSADPVSINIIDRDLPPFTAPYRAELSREARDNWTISIENDNLPKKV
ncbi:hypothetical protein AB205_0026510 [Aquarana catesbeiana]|uniref:Cadherin domain-containing protein n=1 Tax=Aquarana catesbeiana TaxID=8400 RepID=A0A2G9QGP1_AQUCT|nr:hypothetical protein AB205_0026510 [Aquarana catesbeiana]